MEHHNKIYWIKRLLAIVTIILFISGCYYDNEDYLYPESANCETENVSFSEDLWPVINASCTGCHSGASAAGGIKLENYDDVAASAAIGEGNYGSLLGVIRHAPGNSEMPKNGNKLSECTIAKVEAWIDQKALDN